MFRTRSLLCVSVIAAILNVATAVMALPMLTAYAVVGSVDNAQLVSVQGPVAEAGLLSGTGGGSAWGHAEARYGHLKAFSEISISSPFASHAGIAFASASYADDITIVSDTLAAGTEVTFVVRNRFSGHIEANDGFSAASNPSSLGWESAWGQTWWEGLGGIGRQGFGTEDLYKYALGYPTETSTHISLAPPSTIISLRVGQTYSFAHYLATYTTVGGLAFGYTLANFSNSAYLYIDALGDGYTYTTASGTDYRAPDESPTPVSEPASMSLVLAGLTAVGARGWRRWRLAGSR